MRILPWTVARGEKNMKSYILDKGPMSIGVDATAWQTYQQGIVDAELCQSSRIDHAVQVLSFLVIDYFGFFGSIQVLQWRDRQVTEFNRTRAQKT